MQLPDSNPSSVWNLLPSSPTPTFPYRVLSQVGEGAMGLVYRAEDIELGRHVALKVIKPAFLARLSDRESEDAIRRFMQEARAAAALSHPGVTVVHRVGSEGGVPFIAMEWLEGLTIEDLLQKRGRLSLEQAARMGVQVLAVLAVAHKAGVIHRDIKPGNLMLTHDKRIKVTDFGIARVQDSDVAETQAGLILGTPQYAAPEQLAARPVDHRADLYSLGAVLYEVVVGAPPFEASSVYELIARVQSEEVPLPSTLLPQIPPSFDDFIRRALAKRPDDRFSDAREMAAALQVFMNERVSRRQSAPGRAPGQSRATLAQVSTRVVGGHSAPEIVAGLVASWPSRPLRERHTTQLLDRLLEKPLHTSPFCGALKVGGTIFLICDGVLYDAFDVETGARGDLAISEAETAADATLHPCPEGTSPRLMSLLASLLGPAAPQLSGLDSDLVDVGQLAEKLGNEGFDGAVRFARGSQLAFLLFSRGKRILDLFGADWSEDPTMHRWETWLSSAKVTVSVEERAANYPTVTFARQLRDMKLRVERPESAMGDSLREDARADAARITLTPLANAAPSESILLSLVEADPVVAAARWLLADVELQFEQFRRTARWRSMVEPLKIVSEVILHPEIMLGDRRSIQFDAATLDGAGRMLHVIERAPKGTPNAILGFVERLKALKRADGGQDLVGAVLLAPDFNDDALETYLETLRVSKGSGLRAALDRFSHREGFLNTENNGFHLLLVEERSGRRRPLVPQG